MYLCMYLIYVYVYINIDILCILSISSNTFLVVENLFTNMYVYMYSAVCIRLIIPNLSLKT